MLRALGLLFLLLVTAAVAGGAFWLHQERQAREFVVAVSPIIYKEWSAPAVTNRALSVMQTPDFEGQVGDLFRMFSPVLGPLEEAAAPDGTLHFGRADPKLSRGLYGKYSLQAKFRNGEATLDFTVVKEQGAWRIAGFRVNSPALLDALAKKKAGAAPESAWTRGPPDEETAVLAEAEAILRIMDSENPGDTWNRASLQFQEAVTKRRFVAEMKRMREKTGHLQNRRLQGVGFMFDKASADPPGDYAIADFVSTYSRATLNERLGFYRKEGQWKFSGHHWNRLDEKR